MQQTINNAHLEKYLAGITYPANREKIVAHAESQGASAEIISMLQAVDNREYGGPNELSEEIGGIE